MYITTVAVAGRGGRGGVGRKGRAEKEETLEDETRRSNPRQRGGGLALYSNTKSYEREKENTDESEGGRKGKRERETERERGSEKASKRETRRPLHLGEHRRLERNGRSSTQRSGEGRRRGTAAERGAVAGSTCRNSVTHASARELCASDARGERERLGRRRKEGGRRGAFAHPVVAR